MSYAIRQIPQETALGFIHEFKHYDVGEKPHDVWYGVFDDEMLVHVLGVDCKRNHYVVGGVITRPDYRRRGICRSALRAVVKIYGDKKMVAWAMPESEPAFAQNGFVSVNPDRYGAKYMVRESGRT